MSQLQLTRIPSKLSETLQPQRLIEEKLISLLKNTHGSLKQVKLIQTQVITFGFQQNEFIATYLVAACADSNNMVYAQRVFNAILNPNVLLWNAMFKGYSQNGFFTKTLLMFHQMKNRDVRPNCYTFPLLLKSCGKISALREGKQVHCIVLKNGFDVNHLIGTTLIDMYSSGKEVESAYKAFVEMPVKNVVAWTTIVSGYILVGDIVSARRLFDTIPERDVILWNIMISGYISRGDMVTAKRLFDEMTTRDVMSWNTILIGYFTNDDLEAGERFFEEIPRKNVFSWNALMAGYVNKGCFFEVLRAFERMLVESGHPSDATLVYVLSACSRLGALALGKWVHVYAKRNNLMENVFVGNALIDMYSKCGSIETAVVVFNDMVSKDLITWNTLIGGLAMHGHGSNALNVFDEMITAGQQPDGITFVSVLCACSHMGLVEKGISYFNLMTDDYSIVPQIEHYGCMVDLLARAGKFKEVVDFIMKMPIEADDVIWSSLLGACRTYRNVELAEIALKKLIKLHPTDPANYVMLSNIYGDTRRWEDLARLKVMMRGLRIRKPPGCSLIEVNDTLSEFFSFDERHPDSEDIYKVLNELTEWSQSPWYTPDLEQLVEGNSRK